jgi:rhodanese-related sulfurtransferase
MEVKLGIMKRIVKRMLGAATPPSEPATRPPPVRAPSAPAPDMSNIECGVQELKERLDAGEPVLTLDVREPHETAKGIIEGALCIPLGQLESRWSELASADEVVCYCALGGRSLQAAGLLRSKGVDNATSMDGGIQAWQQAGGNLVQVS